MRPVRHNESRALRVVQFAGIANSSLDVAVASPAKLSRSSADVAGNPAEDYVC